MGWTLRWIAGEAHGHASVDHATRRDGDLDSRDKTRLVDVLRGIDSTQEWQEYDSFPAKP